MSLNKFQNINKGETCFVFGDGPSIKWFNLQNFSNHKGICCGNLILHNQFKNLNIKYYAIPEPWLFSPRFLQPKSLDHYVEIGKLIYKKINESDIDVFVNLSNFGSVCSKNIHFIHRYLYKNHSKFLDFKGIDMFGGSFYSTLSLAYFMGFSKVYLIGHDAWTIKRKGDQRWYEHGYEIGPNIDSFSNHSFIKIINEKMDVFSVIPETCEPNNFRHITYEEFTGNKTKFKENNKLISLQNLNILNSSDQYKIFK